MILFTNKKRIKSNIYFSKANIKCNFICIKKKKKKNSALDSDHCSMIGGSAKSTFG